MADKEKKGFLGDWFTVNTDFFTDLFLDLFRFERFIQQSLFVAHPMPI